MLCYKSIASDDHCTRVSLPQGSVQDVQRGHGLLHVSIDHLELRCGGNDLYPLEGSSAAPAGLSDHDQRSHGPGLHQVPAGVDCLAHPRCYICLRSVTKDEFIRIIWVVYRDTVKYNRTTNGLKAKLLIITALIALL